jgi:nitrogen fixation-related uncharacterized protein
MTGQRRTRGEQWSTMYRNPRFDYERDQANMSILIGDVRRSMYIGITIVVVFSFVLILSGGIEAGLNLMLIVGVPLLMVAVAGEALHWWSRRGEQRADPHVRTIFDQLEDFDQLPDSADGQQRHHHPR